MNTNIDSSFSIFKVFKTFSFLHPALFGGGFKQVFGFTPVGKAGDLYGNPIGGTGAVTPTTNKDGQLVVLYADSITRDVTLQLGAGGDEKFENANTVVLEIGSLSTLLVWNTDKYISNNPDIANLIVLAHGNNLEFKIYPSPDLVLSYNFLDLFRETK